MERSVYLGLSGSKVLSLSSVLTRYPEEIAVTHKGWKQEQSSCKGLSERLGSKKLTDLTPSALAEYREERLKKVSPKTDKEELSLLQRVFNVCLKDWGITRSQAGACMGCAGLDPNIPAALDVSGAVSYIK